MKAVVYEAPWQVSVKEVPDARIERPTDVLVRITSANICAFDLHMYEGRCLTAQPDPAMAGAAYGLADMGPYGGRRRVPDMAREPNGRRIGALAADGVRFVRDVVLSGKPRLR